MEIEEESTVSSKSSSFSQPSSSIFLLVQAVHGTALTALYPHSKN